MGSSKYQLVSFQWAELQRNIGHYMATLVLYLYFPGF